MNDEADKSLAPDTPADTLHSHAMNHIALPEDQKFDNEPLMNEVTSHPNLQADTISKLYAHATEHEADDDDGLHDAGNTSSTALSNLLSHPNAPADIKKHFALHSWHPNNPNVELHAKLADSGILDNAALQTMSEKALAAGVRPRAYKHLSPDYYLAKFASGNQEASDPESAHRRTNEIRLGREGLNSSVKHTPQTLDQTIAAFEQSKMSTHTPMSLLSKLVEKREDLSKDQLNKIHQMALSAHEGDYNKREAIDSILQHKNVDPTLLAKYSVGTDPKNEVFSHPNLPRESINALISRVKSPNLSHWSGGQKDSIEALLANPSVTKADVKALVNKGSSDALKDSRADESDVRAWWNKTDKSLEPARDILSAKNVPPDILRELVNHKNQEVAIAALNHPKADMEVVQTALKRKAKAVSDEARLHPLVASTEARNGLVSGKVGLTKAYEDEDYKKHFDAMPADDQQKVFLAANDKYKGDNLDELASKAKERTENVVYSKFKLASDPRAPEAVRNQHAADLSNMFRDKIGKNQEPNETNNRILGGHTTDNGRIIKAVVTLAGSGNKEAQSAILENPAMISTLHSHMKYGEAPSDFLENIYNKMRQYERDGTTIMTQYGQPRPFNDSDDVTSALLESKNLPMPIFHEMARDRDTMESIGSTDLFNRYNALPEEEQNAKYAQILASGSPQANLSILRAKAPRQSWDQAFLSVSPEDRHRFLENNITHVKEHRPDIFKTTALGLYNIAHTDNHPYTSAAQSYSCS